MTTLIAIGFLGGLITGISPCILPVLPVIFFSGTQGGRPGEADGSGAVATKVAPRRTLSETLRPYRVIAGLVLSFSVVTLLGSTLLSLLHLPQDAIRWVALVALVAIGLGLIFPQFEALLEKPFSKLPQKQFGSGQSGFGLGLGAGRAVRAVCGPGAGRHRRRGRHRNHRAGHRRADAVLRGGRGPAVAVLRAGRAAGGRARRRVPAQAAHDPHRRGRRHDPVGRRTGVQPARRAATGDPRLHRRTAGAGRRRGPTTREAQPRRPRQRAERRSCRTAPTAHPSSRAAGPRPTSRASRSGSTLPEMRPST